MTTPELVYCAGGNRRFAEIALRHGFTYGAQLPATVYYPPQFADQDWKRPDRARYMAALAAHRPRMATVLDYETDGQHDEVLAWAAEAAQYVEVVIIIPKVFSTIDRLPHTVGGKPVRLGYSVPTKFGATSVPVWEFGARPVHLLGGSPQRQYALREYLNVASADGNYSQKQAVQRCQYYAPVAMRGGANGHFPQIGEMAVSAAAWTEDVPYLAFELSCINIRNLWALGPVCTVRYGVEEDVEAIVQIARQWPQELGYVMRPALRESIMRRSLFVAVHDRRVIGFVNSRRRRDGVNVVYEIAVRREFVGAGIGTALLNAIPAPVRLKCTTDNQRGNRFYEARGFQHAGIDAGKRRPLNVWERVSTSNPSPPQLG